MAVHEDGSIKTGYLTSRTQTADCAQRVIEQQYPEYVRPVCEGRLQASQQQQLYIAYKDKALAAKELFENGLHNHVEGAFNRCAHRFLHSSAGHSLNFGS